MKAINYYVIIQKIKEEPKKVNGLILDKDNNEVRYLKGKVISAGNETVGIKEGDIIYYDKHAGHNISVENVIYQVIKQGDVVMVE